MLAPRTPHFVRQLRINWYPTVRSCRNEKSYQDSFGCLQSSPPGTSMPVSVAPHLSHQMRCAPPLSRTSRKAKGLGRSHHAKCEERRRRTIELSIRAIESDGSGGPSRCVLVLFEDKHTSVTSISSKPVFGGIKSPGVCRSDRSLAHPFRTGESSHLTVYLNRSAVSRR